MAISAQDATVLWKQNRSDAGVAMQEVLQYALSLDLSKIARFGVARTAVFRNAGLPLGSIQLVCLANNAVQASEYGALRFLTISHGSTVTFNGWVKCQGVQIDAVRGDVVRYRIDLAVIWIVF